MLSVMKLFVLLAGLAGLAAGAQLADVKTVYLFPMRNGFDQILATRLLEGRVFQLTTDPKAADAVLTDRLGSAFEKTFDTHVLSLKDVEEGPRSTFSAGRGTLFLVSKSKQILWSTYQPPKDVSPKHLDRAARKSVEQLKKDLLPPAAH